MTWWQLLLVAGVVLLVYSVVLVLVRVIVRKQPDIRMWDMDNE